MEHSRGRSSSQALVSRNGSDSSFGIRVQPSSEKNHRSGDDSSHVVASPDSATLRDAQKKALVSGKGSKGVSAVAHARSAPLVDDSDSDSMPGAVSSSEDGEPARKLPET